MKSKEVFFGKLFPDFYHPESGEGELFMQYVKEDELEGLNSPWETMRFGIPENFGPYLIYPAFVKRQEVMDAGGVIVPTSFEKR